MILLLGAWGFQYPTRKEVIKAWESGEDFKIYGGPYCSIRDIEILKKDHGRIVIAYGLMLDSFYEVK